MASTNLGSPVLIAAVVVLVLVGLYLIDNTIFGLLPMLGLGPKEGFEGTEGPDANYQMAAGQNDASGQQRRTDTVTNPNVATPATGTSGFKDASGSNFADASGSSFVGGEGFANMEDVAGPAEFGAAQGPAGCYPRDQLTPSELLPKDGSSVWAQQNPMGTGSLKGKNFLSAGALIGVNTVGQSLRNANYQLRSEPPNPQVPVSVFNNSTIEPDVNRRDMEIN
jgi:hypothetical protein